MRFLVGVISLHFLLADAQAQPASRWESPPATLTILDGQILARGLDLTELEVELEDLEHRTVPQRVPVDVGGRFQLYGVAPGQYLVRVLTRTSSVVRRDLVSIRPFGGPLEIRLPEWQSTRPIVGMVSLRRLRVSVPKKAVHEFHKSAKALESGDCDLAIVHLKRALEIEPQFFEALNNLGSCYMRRKEFALALSSFAQAHALDAGSAALESNLAAALLALQRHTEAEEAARRALRLDPGLAAARFLLGLSLAAQDRLSAEALTSFQQVHQRFPVARLAAAEILVQLKRMPEAAAELREYLRSGRVDRRDKVKSWLARLETNLGCTGEECRAHRETSLGSAGGAYETRLPD